MNTVMKKTKVESDGWLKIQAPPELENQEVDVIIIQEHPDFHVGIEQIQGSASGPKLGNSARCAV